MDTPNGPRLDAFAGSVGFLGHGGGQHVLGPGDACDDCRRLGHTRDHPTIDEHVHAGQEHPSETEGAERFDVELDLTAALRRLGRDTEDVTLKLVPVGAAGNRLRADDINVDDIEILID